MSDEKVFEPTARRRKQMREEGRVAMSRDLINAATLLVAMAVLYFFGESMIAIPQAGLANTLTQAPWLQMSVDGFMNYWYGWMMVLLTGFFPFLLLIPAASLLTGLLQTRFLFLSSNLLPDWSKLHPMAGLSRIFSWNACIVCLLGLCKIALVASILGWIVIVQLDGILQLSALRFSDAVAAVYVFLLQTGLKIAGVLFLLALADYGWQYWQYERSLRMTLQEMRDEQRISEGDPNVRARQRQRQTS